MKRTKTTTESAARLLEAARTLHKGRSWEVGPWAELGRLLNESDQTIDNWRSRGVPRTRSHQLAEKVGCRWQWVMFGTGSMTPGPMPESPKTIATYSEDELEVALRFVREAERRANGRLPHDEFFRFVKSVADWAKRLDRKRTDEDEKQFQSMLVNLITNSRKDSRCL